VTVTGTVVADGVTAYTTCTNEICAGVVVTVKGWLLLATPPTVTTTFPVVAPAGTGTTMLVADQLVGVAVVPLNVTVLVPFVEPKFAPVIVTDVPTVPLDGVMLVIAGAVAVTVHVNDWLDESDPSDAVAVTLNVPAVVGAVPEMRPVVLLIDRPVGNPEAEYVSAVPSGSVADNCSETDAPVRLV
jgi:hypothetical protein